MTAVQQEKPWDFSQVYDLLNSLSTSKTTSPFDPLPNDATPRRDSTQLPPLQTKLHNELPASVDSGVGLGDFSKIWQFLGAPPATPSASTPTFAPESPTLQQQLPQLEDYISDGAVYPTSAVKSKGIQWRDEANGDALADIAPLAVDENASKLSKKQRQKRNKKERERLAALSLSRKAVSDVESEAEEGTRTPARKASLHALATSSDSPRSGSPHYNLSRSVGALSTPTTPKISEAPAAKPSLSAKNTKSKSKTNAAEEVLDFEMLPPVTPTPAPLAEKKRQQSVPSSVPTLAHQLNDSLKQQWPVSTTYARANSFFPLTVQPSKQLKERPISSNNKNSSKQVLPVEEEALPETPSRKPRQMIEPKTVRSGEDRHWALLLKLVSDFYEDRSHLVKPANLSNHSNDPRGIHVFVDASNIFIGFHDQLKRARGIPQYQRVPQVNMSFDALALLMERRRPVAKRVLAGSFPHIPAFDTAREIGYECNILDKVYKARELTERQKYFAELERKARKTRRGSTSNGYSSGGGSGSETGTSASAAVAAPTHAPEKFVEQGVDEILHLKILESVVDVEEPTTIVLATGDAAQAEYSQGFMKMVERALRKGWRVELVSWSRNISLMYKKQAFRKKWEDRFRIVELDDYAEELLDM
ncbi:hypothetical protein M8818_004577 [Zalaria obscura]|uniref:Uncharacterized protein n=1 Tax=Zalaria obscura TaxID=2024903 RepID=A0ACC3SC72_9PEZI